MLSKLRGQLDTLKRSHRSPKVSWYQVLALRVGLAVIVAVGFVDAQTHPLAMWVFAALFLVLSVVFAWRWPISELTDHRHALGVAAAGVAAVIIGFAVVDANWNDTGGTGYALVRSGAAFGGLIAMFLGIGVVTMVLRRCPSWKWVAPLSAVIAVVFIIGMAQAGAPSGGWLIAALLAVLLAPLAMALSSEVMIELLAKRKSLLVPAIVGLACAVIGFVIVRARVAVPGATFAIGLAVLAVLVFLIAIRPSLDTATVVLVLACAWANSPQPVARAQSPGLAVAPHDQVFVALGDSYTSGEGAKQFYAGTNVKGSNECRRAPTAYSLVLAQHTYAHATANDAIPHHVIFLACSGASAENFADEPQNSGDPVGGPKVLQPDGTYAPGQTQLAQLFAMLHATGAQVKFAFLMDGGNDVNFSDVAQTCLAPGDCSIFKDRWFDAINQLPRKLDPLYDAVGHAIPNGRVVVVLYPIPISGNGPCDLSTYTPKERRFLAEFTDRLDTTIKDEAIRHHFLVADIRNAFADAHARLCDTNVSSKTAINFVALNPMEGEQITEVADPQNWVHDSMHPDRYGQQLLGDALATWLQNPANQTALAQMHGYHDVPPPTLAAQSPCTSCPSYCTGSFLDNQSCETRWERAKIGVSSRSAAGAFLLVGIFGVWLLCVCLIALWRKAPLLPPNASVPLKV